MRKFFVSCLMLIPILIAPKALAANEFTTAYFSRYQVRADGTVLVTHEIDLKNNLAHIYPTHYTMSVGSNQISEVHASVGSTSIPLTINENGAATSLNFTISNPSIGKDQITRLVINYLSADLIEIRGKTFTINIPKLDRGNEAESLVREVHVPNTFPALSISIPHSPAPSENNDKLVYRFDGYPREGLSLLFGDTADYQINLKYEINNPGLVESDTEIALPPDTAYQKMLVESLDPQPLSISSDQDGNWLARYRLGPQNKLIVNAVLYARVSAIPRFFDPSTAHSGLTKETVFWETKNFSVVQLASQLTSPENIYHYLVENFRYNYDRIEIGAERLGAARSLEATNEALCTEFTDTFIALARASGVKAREINGFAMSNSFALKPINPQTDILHSWPEFFDPGKGSWQNIDPTWGQTTGGINYFDKLDYSHIAFVRHGEESTYPLPAGVYRFNTTDRQIEVKTVEKIPDEIINYTIVSQEEGKSIKNTGNVALVNQRILVDGKIHELSYLPPYGIFNLPQDRKPAFPDMVVMFSVFTIILLAALLVVRLKNARHHH